MFKTDETVRFGQILSARTLRYGKFNEYIIIIISAPIGHRCPIEGFFHSSRLNARMHGYLSINTKNPPTVDFGNLHVNAYIDVRHLDVTRLNTFKSPSIHQLERLGFAQPGRPPLRPCTIKYMETLTWVQLVGKLGNKSGAQPWVCRTAHGMRCRPAVLSWRVIETN